MRGNDKSFGSTTSLIIIFVALVVSGIAQAIFFKRIGYSMGSHPWFVLNVVSFSFVPILSAICVVIIAISGGFSEETSTWFFKRHFLLLGVLNGLNGVGVLLSNPHIPGATQALLSQSVIPFTLILAITFLRTKLSLVQCIGVLFVIIGGIIELWDSTLTLFQHPSLQSMWPFIFTPFVAEKTRS